MIIFQNHSNYVIETNSTMYDLHAINKISNIFYLFPILKLFKANLDIK